MATTIFTPSMLRGAGTRGVPEMPAGSSFTNTYSCNFDGADDYIEIYNGAEGSGPILFTASDDFSFSVWVRTSSTAAQNQIISFRGTALIWFYTFMTGANRRFKMYLRDDSGNTEDILSYNNSNGWITDDAWTHLVFTRNGTTKDMNLYMNGASAQATKSDTTSDDFTAYDKFTVANDEYSGGRYEFTGNIDELSVWGKQLSSAEVAALYNSGTPTDLAGEAGLTNWWRMGDGATYPTIPDAAGSSAGTMTNMSSGDIENVVP